MKKFSRTPAVLAAVITSLLLTALVTACNDTPGTWGHHSEGPTFTGGDSSGSATYTGSLTVNGVTYTSLTMNGSPSSGTAVLSGNSGNASGSYSNSGGSRAAVTLNLNGSYTLTFSFGTITAVFSNPTVTLSQGSVSASGTASLSSSTEPAISTLSGKTFVNSANSNDYIVGLSDSTLEWHNPPSTITQAVSMGSYSNYDSSTGILSGCTYEICRAGESPTSVSSSVPALPVPYVFVNYQACYETLAIESATTIKTGSGNTYVFQ